MSKLPKIFLLLVSLSVLSACKQPNLSNEPVSYWLNDHDACVRETAKAIVDSGRPYPNEIRDAKGNLVQKDVWIGDQLYELPGWFPLDRSGLPYAHPLAYSFVFGSAEYVLKIPEIKFKAPGVGGTLYGNLRCDRWLPVDTWIENKWPNAPSRVALIDSIMSKPRTAVRSITTTEIKKLGMTEIRFVEDNGRVSAIYIPKSRDISQDINGTRAVKAIGCSAPYEPESGLDTSHRCFIWIYLGPGLWLETSVYQQMLPVLPDLHDLLLKTLIASRRK